MQAPLTMTERDPPSSPLRHRQNLGANRDLLVRLGHWSSIAGRVREALG